MHLVMSESSTRGDGQTQVEPDYAAAIDIHNAFLQDYYLWGIIPAEFY